MYRQKEGVAPSCSWSLEPSEKTEHCRFPPLPEYRGRITNTKPLPSVIGSEQNVSSSPLYFCCRVNRADDHRKGERHSVTPHSALSVICARYAIGAESTECERIISSAYLASFSSPFIHRCTPTLSASTSLDQSPLLNLLVCLYPPISLSLSHCLSHSLVHYCLCLQRCGLVYLCGCHSYLHVVVHEDSGISCHPQLKHNTWNKKRENVLN